MPHPAYPDASFWTQKLAAFLHDPPSKALDIRRHEETASAFYAAAGLDPKLFEKPADWMAAAADRIPFPSRQIHCKFDGKEVTFRHPLSGASLPLPELTAELAIENSAAVQPILTGKFPADWDAAQTARAKYFAHWRKWRQSTIQKDWRLAFFPADTRIPDHSIWHHVSVVSALSGCTDSEGNLRPAFLKLQIGPVQDFIAAAKSVRDLWSGSYLLSWLMAAGLKALSGQVGPDCVIFPSLFEQPLVDLQWRDDLWSKVFIGDKTIWESMGYTHKELLVPNLPNVFLALVPAHRATELGELVEAAIRAEWQKITEACWNHCDSAAQNGTSLTSDEPGLFTRQSRKARFEKQNSHFLQVSWVSEPWPDDLKTALEAAAKFSKEMPIGKATTGILKVVKMATEQMEFEHRDERYYSDKSTKTTLRNQGVAWASLIQFANWKLDAVRQTRHFNAWTEGGWGSGTANNKDALNGKEEAVAGGATWRTRCEALGGAWESLFKTDAWIGSSTLIKRVWHLAYLAKEKNLKTSSADFPMPDTRKVAGGEPEAEENENSANQDASEKYFAVLALDGDEIGKWVSGEKSRPIGDLLAPPAREYFEQSRFGDFLKTPRPLSPGFHLQFSETLSNFALKVVPLIVAHFQGRLIYAGGDDVLAMLPADKALGCAKALRSAFRGEDPDVPGVSSPAPGFLCSDKYRQETGARFLTNENRIPFPVPGPHADVSVGIALAHFKHPLQDVVREAQAAEKRAKNAHRRGAVAMSTFKRSGEILHWGCKWNGGGIELFGAIADAMSKNADFQLSGRFPHRVCELFAPYLNNQTAICSQTAFDDFPAHEILKREFEFAAIQQGSAKAANQLQPYFDTYLEGLPHENNSDPIAAVIGLCRSVAFANRTRSEK
jgi:CRISPR-associated protein Cmr2